MPAPQERNCVWACAPLQKEARDPVAARTGFDILGATGAKSHWQDETASSCVAPPTMTITRTGDVIGEDGSPVYYKTRKLRNSECE
jgi:hypothetical protein